MATMVQANLQAGSQNQIFYLVPNHIKFEAEVDLFETVCGHKQHLSMVYMRKIECRCCLSHDLPGISLKHRALSTATT